MVKLSWLRVLHIARKEIIQIRRDPNMVKLILIAPVLQLILFGYAITSDVRFVRTAVLDMDNTRESRELVERFAASYPFFDITGRLAHPGEIDGLLDSGRAQVAIWVPKGFARSIASGRPAAVQAIVDGTDSATANIIAGYINAITAAYSGRIQTEALMRRGLSTVPIPSVQPRVRAWYNPDLRSVNFLVPGVLAMILMIITMMLTSLAVVREREIGTLEQLVVTPIRSLELMLGKIVPFALVGFIDVTLIVIVATLWFRVPVAGSVPLLFAMTAVFLVASLGLGLLISTVSRTQQQAMMVSFFVMQPAVLLSGFMFPIENMPRAVQMLTYLIPLRYYLEIVRGIFLRGVGLEALWQPAAALLALGTFVTVVSVLRFHKTID